MTTGGITRDFSFKLKDVGWEICGGAVGETYHRKEEEGVILIKLQLEFVGSKYTKFGR